MKIVVISLKSSQERRDSIEQQFRDLGVDFEFFDAVRPSGSSAHLRGYDEEEFIVNCGRPATDTEIACYASHLALWRLCADQQEPFLILEDDARLDSDFLAGLFVTSSQVSKLGFIRVSLPHLATSTRVNRLGPFDIHYCMRAPLLALGYAVSPEVAAQLVHSGGTVEEPVDKFLQRFWRYQRPVFAIVPPIVTLSSLADESDIGQRSKPRVTAGIWIRRAARKARNSVSRTLYNAAFLGETGDASLRASGPAR